MRERKNMNSNTLTQSPDNLTNTQTQFSAGWTNEQNMDPVTGGQSWECQLQTMYAAAMDHVRDIHAYTKCGIG